MKHVPKRVIVKVNVDGKNWYSFSNGMTIRLERGFDNFDRKYTEQVMGIVIDAEDIPTDALVLFHHNSLHETYEILNHRNLSGDEIATGIKIFSIMERDIFFWKEVGDEQWKPTKSFATGLRVFRKYQGILLGIEPKLVRDLLYVTSGELNGKLVGTLKSSDYQITFRNEEGRDESIIRFRPFGDEEREPEAIIIRDDLMKDLDEGRLLIGLTATTAKPLYESELVYHDRVY